ncbi:MAG: hypothetical protein AMS27_05635 [Bacteroides sp. SM23_62_1]|nr:MAG: hypothetical protein AMS27_05635 [Bacteroides sp. SM23_62_1]
METTDYERGTFGYDLQFLNDYIDPVILKDPSGKSLVIASKEWQGRVLTSSAAGLDGTSYGWINYNLIESKQLQPHMNAFGGEDRLWLGPEGGQFSIYFREGTPFEFEHWFVPEEIDTEPFELLEAGDQYARFGKNMKLVNYSGFRFSLDIIREIRLLNPEDVEGNLGTRVPDNINIVAYESESMMTNKGSQAWTKETGMLSIWILGMFTPSPSVTIIIPYKQGDESAFGPVVNDTYFGKISSDRMKISDGIIFFRGDGKSRGKIGLSPLRVIPLAGSYDADNKTLTVVQFSFREGIHDYVNSMWEIQDEPFRGDVLNSYNDGPLEDGSQMGPFYELESSSPAANLQHGESINHLHRTYHFQGNEDALDEIARKIFGVSLERIKSAFL